MGKIPLKWSREESVFRFVTFFRKNVKVSVNGLNV